MTKKNIDTAWDVTHFTACALILTSIVLQLLGAGVLAWIFAIGATATAVASLVLAAASLRRALASRVSIGYTYRMDTEGRVMGRQDHHSADLLVQGGTESSVAEALYARRFEGEGS